jgi:hypothetical protein
MHGVNSVKEFDDFNSNRNELWITSDLIRPQDIAQTVLFNWNVRARPLQ